MRHSYFAILIAMTLWMSGCGSGGNEPVVAPDPTDPVADQFVGAWTGFITSAQNTEEEQLSSALAYEIQLGPPVDGIYEGTGRIFTLSEEEESEYARFGVRATVVGNTLTIEQTTFVAPQANRKNVGADTLRCQRSFSFPVQTGELEGTWASAECGNGITAMRRPEEPRPLWFETLPDCPCLLTNGLEGRRQLDKQRRPGNWSEIEQPGDLKDRLFDTFSYHPGASFSVRWVPATDDDDSGQQCTYDSDRQLITGGLGAGTPDLVSPDGPDFFTYWHRIFDVNPFKETDPAKRISCASYFLRHPPNNGNSCFANPKGTLQDETSELSCGEAIDQGLIDLDPEAPDNTITPLRPVPVSYTDPHLVTIDGLGYDFQAVGEFVLARSILPGLEIQSRQVQYGGEDSQVSVNAAFAFDVDGDTVSAVPALRGENLGIFVNGEAQPAVDLIELANGGKVSVQRRKIEVAWPDGSVAVITDRGNFLNLSLALNERHAGRISGLLGNFDGNSQNDLLTSDGRDITPAPPANELYGAFAEGWRVTDETSLFHYFDGQNTGTFTNRLIPGELATVDSLDEGARTAAASACAEAGITEPTLLENCILDVAVSGDTFFAAGMAEVQQGLENEIAPASVQGTIDLPTLQCESQLVDPKFNSIYSGSFTDPGANTNWLMALKLAQCDTDVVGSFEIGNFLPAFQKRRITGLLVGDEINLKAGFPFESTGLTPCKNMEITLAVTTFGLEGNWTASDCPLGGAVKLNNSGSTTLRNYSGNWAGTVSRGAQSYPITLDVSIQAGVLEGAVEYPSLGCSGALTYKGFDRLSDVFTETLSTPGSCLPDGTVHLRPGNRELIYEWFGPDGNLGATSILTKVQ